MGNLESCKLSEIPWQTDSSEKFFFENERVCIVHYAGELTIVEYGRNEVLGTCRTEHMVRDVPVRGPSLLHGWWEGAASWHGHRGSQLFCLFLHSSLQTLPVSVVRPARIHQGHGCVLPHLAVPLGE